MSQPVFSAQPKVDPVSESAPLVAFLSAPTQEAKELRVRIEQADDVWTIVSDVGRGPYLLLGFHPCGTAVITVQAVGETGEKITADPIRYDLCDLPTSPLDMPPLETRISRPERMSGRFTFLTIRRRALGRIIDMTMNQRRWFTQWGMLIAIDNKGRMRWMRKLDRRAAGITTLNNGNVFVHDTDFCSREIGMDGATVNAWFAAQRPQGPLEGGIPVDVRSLHHQPHQMPNGNFLALSAHSKVMKDWPASTQDPDGEKRDREIVGDMIVEFSPKGEVVWSWDSFDHLDPYRIGYDAHDAYWHVRGFPNAADWTHGNGVAYDPRDDSVLVSFRLQDCVLKVDRKSGEIVWILGDHGNWSESLSKKLLAPVGEHFRWPWHMHNPRITSEGTIVLFDNGIYGARPGDERIPFHKSFSRGVEYRVNETDMTVEQVWSSALSEEDIHERTWAMGDAHRFEDTDTALVVHSICMPHGRDDIGLDEADRSLRYVDEFPSYARILEISRKDSKDIVFDLKINDPFDLFQWEAFSAVRVDDLYPEGSGARIEFGDHLLSERGA